MTYTKEFLISELHRFVRENGRIPRQIDMQPKFGYPNGTLYRYYFKTFNNAFEIAGLEINQKHQKGILDGTETCAYCGKRADEILNFKQWFYPGGIRYCYKHGQERLPDYVSGNLDINSSTGLGRAGEICVIKTLGIGKEHDCNRESCNYSIDMYNDEYGKIDVKTCCFYEKYNNWVFEFPDKSEIKTFICLGLSSYRKSVEHVWIVPNNGNKKSLSASNTSNSLLKNSKYEIDSKPYNDTWKTMKLDSCKIMIDKKKEQTEEEKEKSLQSRKELIQELGLKGYEEINGEMVFKLTNR